MKPGLSLPCGCWMLALVATLLVTGACNQSDSGLDQDVLLSHRERLVLAEEPDGVVGVLDVRALLAGPADVTPSEDQTEPANSLAVSVKAPEAFAVVGRIGGIPNPWKQARPEYPWKAGQAEFVIADPAAAIEVDDHGHSHDDPDHDCPFCADAADSGAVAVVRFTDETGKVIPIDAKQLFDLKGEETVVVRGKAEILGDAKTGVLVVNADGLYVRR